LAVEPFQAFLHIEAELFPDLPIWQGICRAPDQMIDLVPGQLEDSPNPFFVLDLPH
jgi:hypothetical protein